MKFEDIWRSLIRKKPELVNPETKLEFTSVNLKALLLQVYEQGQKSVPKAEASSNPFMDQFLDSMRRK